MAQAGFTPISLYFSTTAAATPSAGNLVAGELALNTVDEKLYFKNSAGTVKLLASSSGSTATVSSVSVVSANGLAGTVATATTTPAITLTTTITGVLKGNGSAISAAVSGTDYAPATSGTAIFFGNGAGGFSNVTIGTGVSFAGGTLSATGAGGTVTSVTGSGNIASSGGNTPNITFTGTLPVGNGGTGLTAGTSGGILAYTASGTLASSALLTQYGVVYGGGAGAVPVATAAGTTGQVLTATTSGAPSFQTPGGGAQDFLYLNLGVI